MVLIQWRENVRERDMQMEMRNKSGNETASRARASEGSDPIAF